jgi:hypothetical protein
LRSERVNFVEVKRCVEGRRERQLPDLVSDIRIVTGFHCQDLSKNSQSSSHQNMGFRHDTYGSGGGKVILILDVLSSAQICGDTDTLKHAGEGDKLVHVADPKIVGASCYRGGAGSSEGGGQEADVSGLVVGECLDLAVELGGVTG